MGRKRKADSGTPSLVNQNDSSNSSITSLNSLQRSAANDRERTRMRVLSKAFVRLKTSLPWVPSDTKLSKLDTLKLAASYIAYLTQLLDNDDENSSILLCQNLETGYSSSKMVSSIRLSPIDMQHIINQHLFVPQIQQQNHNYVNHYS
ncbi:transcription factor 21, partial [Brachionus plicatilis]